MLHHGDSATPGLAELDLVKKNWRDEGSEELLAHDPLHLNQSLLFTKTQLKPLNAKGDLVLEPVKAQQRCLRQSFMMLTHVWRRTANPSMLQGNTDPTE
ncbi:uncharacterized [Tachysurus ichikawai]